jgi:hypothetical protein
VGLVDQGTGAARRRSRAAATEPQFSVAVRAGVTAASVSRYRQLMARLLGSFHAANGSEARLVRRLLGQLRADDLAKRLETMLAQVEAPPRRGSTLELLVEAPRFELGSADAVRGCLQV